MVCLSFPHKIWFELHPEHDCCDAFVQMEDGYLYSAVFITSAYIQRQMRLTSELARLQPEAAPVAYAVLDMAHIVVETMARETLEDAIYNLIAQDVFEGCFTVASRASAPNQLAAATTAASLPRRWLPSSCTMSSAWRAASEAERPAHQHHSPRGHLSHRMMRCLFCWQQEARAIGARTVKY